jgi:hypothetical protein
LGRWVKNCWVKMLGQKRRFLGFLQPRGRRGRQVLASSPPGAVSPMSGFTDISASGHQGISASVKGGSGCSRPTRWTCATSTTSPITRPSRPSAARHRLGGDGQHALRRGDGRPLMPCRAEGRWEAIDHGSMGGGRWEAIDHGSMGVRWEGEGLKTVGRVGTPLPDTPPTTQPSTPKGYMAGFRPRLGLPAHAHLSECALSNPEPRRTPTDVG